MAVDFDKGIRPNVYELMLNGGFELPIATDETLGGVIIGPGVNVDEEGVISVTAPAPVDTYTKEEIDEQQEAQDYNITSNSLAIERIDAALDNFYTKSEIDTQQQTQDANITANASAIAAAQNNIDAIEAHQTVQDTNINVNATAILGMSSDISTIQAQQQTQDANIAANTSAIAELEDEIESLTTDYYTKSEVDAQQQTQDTAISINAQNIAIAQSNIATIQTQQQTQDANIAANTSDIADLENALADETAARTSEDSALQDNIDNNTAAITALSTQIADDDTLGLVKTDSAKFISTDENGVLQIGGRLGQFPNGGVYYPETIDPVGVGTSTFLMTDGAKGLLSGSREFCILAGAGLTCRTAAAGATQYYFRNTQANRVALFAAQNGFAAIDQTDAIANGTARITDISFANGNPISFYFGVEETNNDIIVTLERTINPESTNTKMRVYGFTAGSDVIAIGQGTAASNGKAIALGQSCYAGANQVIALGNGVIVVANNSAGFGHTHLVNKQFCFAAGQGHDFSNGRNGASAIGIASELSNNTLFAVGNGTYAASGAITRSNAFEVVNDGIILKSPNNTKFKISVDNNGNLVTTQL